jgi:hypothetical protein
MMVDVRQDETFSPLNPWTCAGRSSIKTLSGLVQSQYQNSRNALVNITLTLWQETRPLVCGKPEECQELLEELLQVSDKVWNRLGLLLFASNEWIVKAVIGIMENLANTCTNTKTIKALVKRIVQSEWKQYMIDKIRFCHEATLEQFPPQQQEDQFYSRRRPHSNRNTRTTSHRGGRNLGVDHTMSLRLLDACVKILLRQEDTLEPKDIVSILDLLLYLVQTSSSLIEDMSIHAIRQIIKLVVATNKSIDTQAFLLDQLNRSGLFETILHHLQDQDQIFQQQQQQQQSSSSSSCVNVRRQQMSYIYEKEKEEKQEDNVVDLAVFVEFELLTTCILYFGATFVNSFFYEKTFFLSTICHLLLTTGNINNSHPKWQLQTLIMLETLLLLSSKQQQQQQVEITSSLTSQMRINGDCMTLSWLLLTPNKDLQQAAYRVLQLVIQKSPRIEMVRALVEQGCVVILEIVYRYRYLRATSDSDDLNQIKHLLNWIKESMNERNVSILMTSLTRSTNILLQKNIILGLFILAININQCNPNINSIRRSEPPKEQEDKEKKWSLYGYLVEKEFIHDTVASVVQQQCSSSDHNDASLAVALLKFFYTTTTYIEKTNQETLVEWREDKKDTVDVLKEGMGCVVSIKTKNLYRYCPALRSLLDDQKSMIDLSGFSLQSIYFLKEVIEEEEEEERQGQTKISWMTLARMKRFTSEQMMDLLKLAYYIQNYEFQQTITTYLIETPGFFQLDTWYPLFETASQVDAPLVMRQSIQFALEKYEETIVKSYNFDLQLQPQGRNRQNHNEEENSKSFKLCTELRQTVLILLEYLFIKLDPTCKLG